jgi:hypothetical protein
MDSAAGHLDGTFVREYLGDLPIRPTPTAKLLNEFSVRLKRERGGLPGSSSRSFFRLASMFVNSGASPNYKIPSAIFLTIT